MLTFPFIIALLISIGSATNDLDEDEGSCGGITVDYPPLEKPFPRARPPPEPDPTSFKPFQVLFLPGGDYDQEYMQLLQEGIEYINGKLGKILKAPRLQEIPLKRLLANGTCKEAQCGSTDIPLEYTLPCDNNSQIVTEKKHILTDKIKGLNPGDYSLVIIVRFDSEETRRHDKCDRKDPPIAFANSCQHDDRLRPTHGSITICEDAAEMHKQKFLNTFLHETFHVIAVKLDGSGLPINLGTYRDKAMVENITWKYVTRHWPLEADSKNLTTLQIAVTITQNVLAFVKGHFNCTDVEGAELVLELQKKKKEWKSDNGHWSQRLFNDDILAPTSTSGRRISNLTLSFLKDTKWYDVDMSHAEPLVISRPQERGCDVALKSCHEVLDIKSPNGNAVKLTRPFCDKANRVITPLCTPDGGWLLRCTSSEKKTLNCDVTIGFPYPRRADAKIKMIDDPKCRMATRQPDAYTKQGLRVGNGTTCITFIDASWMNETVAPACVAYECRQDGLVLKFQNKDHSCNISLTPGQHDNKITQYTFEVAAACSKLFPSGLKFIRPEVNAVCPGARSPPPPTTITATSTPSITTSSEHRNYLVQMTMSVQILLSLPVFFLTC